MIVFFTNQYYPKPLANGVCIHEIAKAIVRYGLDVLVVCYSRIGEPIDDIIDGVTIKRVTRPYYISLFESPNKLISLIGRFISLVHKLINITQYPLRDTYIVKQFVKIGESVIAKYPDITLVATYTPMEAVTAVAKLKVKFPHIKSVYYSLDTLSNESGWGIIPDRYRKSFGLQRESSLFDLYDSIILMNCHKWHYDQEFFAPLRYKFQYADFPLFVPEKSKNLNKYEYGNIVYAGSLYRSIRNPQQVIKYLEPILNIFKLHFYGYSDCDDIIERYIKQYPTQIYNHGFVPYNLAQSAVDSAHILLSIGNSGTDMAPSKIYEYMSKGKPIIHTYTNDNDSCIKLLQVYGNALCIDLRNAPKPDELKRFVQNAAPHKFSSETQMFLTARPDYTLKLILKGCNENS